MKQQRSEQKSMEWKWKEESMEQRDDFWKCRVEKYLARLTKNKNEKWKWIHISHSIQKPGPNKLKYMFYYPPGSCMLK